MTSEPSAKPGGVESNRLLWFIDEVGIWSVNPYKKCAFRCVYCIARSQGEAVPWYPADTIIPKIRTALTQVPQTIELFVGALVDAYPPVEEELCLTRTVLKEISRQARPFCINTKSTLVCRDTDILLNHQGHCDVYIGLCSLDDDILCELEPGAPSASDRLDAVNKLNDAGIDVNIDAGPWIPGISNAEDLITKRPAGVNIQFEPLDIRHFGDSAKILGRTYTQEEINSYYQAVRQKIGDVTGVSWKDPPPPRRC